MTDRGYHIVLFRDKAGQWRWRVVADNGQVILSSCDPYVTKASMMRTVDRFSQATQTPIRAE